MPLVGCGFIVGLGAKKWRARASSFSALAMRGGSLATPHAWQAPKKMRRVGQDSPLLLASCAIFRLGAVLCLWAPDPPCEAWRPMATPTDEARSREGGRGRSGLSGDSLNPLETWLYTPFAAPTFKYRSKIEKPFFFQRLDSLRGKELSTWAFSDPRPLHRFS